MPEPAGSETGPAPGLAAGPAAGPAPGSGAPPPAPRPADQIELRITEFPHVAQAQGRDLDLTWAELVARLKDPVYSEAKDDVGLFSPTRFEGARRAKANARYIYLMVLDVDNKQAKDGSKPVTGREVGAALKAHGLAGVLATSWSNTQDLPKFRVLLPLLDPVPAEAWSRYVPAALESSGLMAFAHGFDLPCTLDVARQFFWPSAPFSQVCTVVEIHGLPLAVQIPPEPGPRPAPDAPKPNGGSPPAPRPARAARGDYSTLDVVGWFTTHGCYGRPGAKPGQHLVRCPWDHLHAHPGKPIDSSTAVWEASGGCWPQFDCKSTSHQQAGIKELLELWGDADRHCRDQLGPKPAAQPGPQTTSGSQDPGSGTPPAPAAGAPELSPQANLEQLHSWYLYVYGAKQVIDWRTCEVFEKDDFTTQYADYGRHWLKDPSRKSVRKRDVVFDPLGYDPGRDWRHRDPSKVNTFRGLPLEPRPDAPCEALVTLFDYLLHGEGQEVRDWVWRWLAAPLQRTGIRMNTAVIVTGPQGIGKSLIFTRTMREIYGPYSYKLNNQTLTSDSRFTSWLAQKLYIVGEEVQTYVEHSSTLKDWVTADTVKIEKKRESEYEEPNHVNWTFLTNQGIPVHLEKSDRRFCVVRGPQQPLERAFYDQVLDELAHGGAAGFLARLIETQIPTDWRSDQPPKTQAKDDLIEASRDPVEAFLDAWLTAEPLAEDRSLPLCAANQGDLYTAFRVFCSLRGTRSPAQHVFAQRLIASGRVRRERAWEGNQGAKFTRYIPQGAPAPGAESGASFADQASLFYERLQGIRAVASEHWPR